MYGTLQEKARSVKSAQCTLLYILLFTNDAICVRTQCSGYETMLCPLTANTALSNFSSANWFNNKFDRFISRVSQRFHKTTLSKYGNKELSS